MKRKEFLKKGALAAIVAPAALTACKSESSGEKSGATSAPNINKNKTYRWKMVTTWPPNFPVLGEGCQLMADWVREMSDGRLDIQVYGGGELIPALEAFDAVSNGTAEMGNGAAYYWAGKMPAGQFFASVPFGMNAQQLSAWIVSGGGLKLWKELYAKFNLIPFLSGNTGVQMGGWFNKEINSIEDLKGLKMRIPGLGGKVLVKAGGSAVLSPGSEIYTNLERGVIDATEWIGPYHDYKMGFHKIAKYYYAPGWHECASNLETFVNKQKIEALPKDLQAILRTAIARQANWTLAEFDVQNAIYLEKIKQEGKVEIRTFSKEILDELRNYTKEVIAEITAKDTDSKKVYEAYSTFKSKAEKWSALTEKLFYERLL